MSRTSFDDLWDANRKKVSRGQAERTYWKLEKAGKLPPHNVLLDIFKRRQDAPDWTKEGRQYQPHLSTWLRAEGWLDVLPGKKAPTVFAEPETAGPCNRCSGLGQVVDMETYEDGKPATWICCPDCSGTRVQR